MSVFKIEEGAHGGDFIIFHFVSVMTSDWHCKYLWRDGSIHDRAVGGYDLTAWEQRYEAGYYRNRAEAQAVLDAFNRNHETRETRKEGQP